MSEIKIKRIVDVSVTATVEDLLGILNKLDPLDIFTLESGNNETASEHLANVLVGWGYKAIFGDGVKVEEKPKRAKAKGPKAPRLTKAQKAEIDKLQALEENTAESLADAVNAEVSQVKRYLKKAGK